MQIPNSAICLFILCFAADDSFADVFCGVLWIKF